jgi:hypothetical protein
LSNFFQSIFEKQKQTCFDKKIQPNLKKKKTYHHLIFVEYKKSSINLFPHYCIKNKFKSEKRAKHPTPNILGSGCGARPNILGYCCAARPKIDGSGWATRPNTFLKCFGFGWPTTPNAVTPFGNVLGLAANNVWSRCQARTIIF